MGDKYVDEMPTDVSETTEKGIHPAETTTEEEQDAMEAEGCCVGDGGGKGNSAAAVSNGKGTGVGGNNGGEGGEDEAGDEAARAKAAALFGAGSTSDGDTPDDPLLAQPPSTVRDGDYVLLHFGDGKQVFAHCVSSWRGKSPPVKIAKRSYPTANLIGLPYGTVLELGRGGLFPLPEGEGVLPDPAEALVGRKSGTCSPIPPGSSGDRGPPPGAGISYAGSTDEHSEENDPEAEAEAEADEYGRSRGGALGSLGGSQSTDNRNLVDSNTAQAIRQDQVMEMREGGVSGSDIVAALIASSSTFDSKTDYSKVKYIARKQLKYQPRCRMVRCTGATICEACYLKEPRRMMNLREDTLAQILSYSNVCAGCQVMVFETCMGVITGALAQRMGGYGKIISLYPGQQPSFGDMIARFNLSFAENHSIKWLHTGEVFAEDASLPVAPSTASAAKAAAAGINGPQSGSTAGAPPPVEPVIDYELAEREQLQWPCPLQQHTRTYLENMATDKERADFLAKRCARFARKLTRHTVLEARSWVHDPERLCSSLIIATKFDPTTSLLKMLPHLAPSCPFVVHCEFIEPLAECFRELQRQSLAINLRLTDTWMREYQVLPGRTHPNMSMSQSGGFLLTGVKLCPVTGKNELDDSVIKALRAQAGSRRGRRQKQKKKQGKGDREAKRARIEK